MFGGVRGASGSTSVREGQHVGVSEVGGAAGRVEGQVGGGGAYGVRDESGLNPNRIRGFGVQQSVGGRGGAIGWRLQL